jgi:hypothetical protein
MTALPAEATCPRLSLFAKDLASGYMFMMDAPLGAPRLQFAVAALHGRQLAVGLGHVDALGEDQYLAIIYKGVRFGGVTERWYDSLDRALRDGSPPVDNEPHAASSEFVERLNSEGGGVHLVRRTRPFPGRGRVAQARREFRLAEAEQARRQRSCERVWDEWNWAQSELGRKDEALRLARAEEARAADRLAQAVCELARAERELAAGEAEAGPTAGGAGAGPTAGEAGAPHDGGAGTPA